MMYGVTLNRNEPLFLFLFSSSLSVQCDAAKFAPSTPTPTPTLFFAKVEGYFYLCIRHGHITTKEKASSRKNILQ